MSEKLSKLTHEEFDKRVLEAMQPPPIPPQASEPTLPPVDKTDLEAAIRASQNNQMKAVKQNVNNTKTNISNRGNTEPNSVTNIQ